MSVDDKFDAARPGDLTGEASLLGEVRALRQEFHEWKDVMKSLADTQRRIADAILDATTQRDEAFQRIYRLEERVDELEKRTA